MSRAPLHERVRTVLREMALLPEGAAINYESVRVSQGEGGHGKHGTTTAPPPRVNSLAVEWAERLDSILQAAERDLDEARRGSAPVRINDPGRNRRIVGRSYEGRAATFVAFVEGISERRVLELRANAGLDPRGFKRPAPLTSKRPPEEA